jgi:N-acyl-D-aspartate/D-glutamate deacylase
MELYDLIIRGGTIHDGSGADGFVGDVAVKDGVIVKVGKVDGQAPEEVDATGKIVTPGFVDLHTHYDGQAIWSNRLAPSSQHGVTTVVIGNCGVGFAPCRPGDQDMLVNVMEGVEDIPEVVMTKGLPWDWETFPEYLDALDRRARDIDVAAYLPHSPLRVYAMGERGANREEATPEDLARMQELVTEALDAGALGFATSRVFVHQTKSGVHIPSYETNQRELFAIGEAMGKAGKGLFQIVVNIGDVYDREIQFLADFAERTGRPVTYTLAQTNSDSTSWQRTLATLDAANAAGSKITGQVFPRPVGLVMGLDTSVHPFTFCKVYEEEIAHLPLAERVAKMRDPDVRARLLADEPHDPSQPIYLMARMFERAYPLESAADYEPDAERSIAALAAKAGVSPVEYVYDLLLRKDGYQLIYAALANYADGNLDAVRTMMENPNVVVGLGDGGAHYGVVCDASYATFLITHWTRDRKGDKLKLADVIHDLTRRPAEVASLLDRGLIREGYKADLNVIDYDRLTVHIPHMVKDLPGNGRRLTQEASGFVATIVNGEIILRDDQPTRAFPGRLVRGPQKDKALTELATV